MFRLVLCVALFTIASCEPPVGNSYIPPQPSSQYGPPQSQYGAPTNNYQSGYSGQQEQHQPAEPFQFEYNVNDQATGNMHSRQEKSDGNQVQGEYRVALPDGRTQIVTYWADWQSGFHSNVRYEGEAQYPQNNGGYSRGPSNQYGTPNQDSYNRAPNTGSGPY